MAPWQRVAVGAGVLGIAVLFASTGRVDAQASQFLVNGQSTLLVFDANGNGVIPDAGDCVVTGTNSGGDDFALTMTQDTEAGAVPLKVCEMCDDYLRTQTTYEDPQFNGGGYVSSSEAVGSIFNTCIMGLGTPYVSIVLDGSSPSNTLVSGSSNDHTFMPLAGIIYNDSYQERELLGSGILCSTGAEPGVAVQGRGGLRLLVGLNKVSSGGRDYRCAPVPMPRADTGAYVTIESCVPVDTEDRSMLSLERLALMEVDFRRLPACGGERVPTASEMGLMVMALGLIVGGTLVLRRRDTFRSAMPQF